MKNYTAYYSMGTEYAIQYSFNAAGAEEAIRFASGKFAKFPQMAIMEHGRGDEGRLVFVNGSKIR